MVHQLTAQEAQALLESGQFDLVDVREVPEFATGHLAGARHVSLGRLRQNVRAAVPRDKVIFVCAAGTRSNMAAQLALAAGLQEVYNLAGGTRGWVKAGFSLVRPTQQATG
jgi:rhodanese-related sulfurtransferase